MASVKEFIRIGHRIHENKCEPREFGDGRMDVERDRQLLDACI
jgi:hypothetical protein